MSAPVQSAAPDTGVTQLVIPRKSDADLITMLTRRLPGVVTVKSAITYDREDKSCRLTPGISGFRVAARSRGGEQEVTSQ